MDSQQFKSFAKEVIDYIAEYYDTIRDRSPYSLVEPGFLTSLVPKQIPEKGEYWKEIFKDIKRIVEPGATHLASPYFYSFYPTGNSFASFVGEVLTAGFSAIAPTWDASPAVVELEMAMMNWLGKLLALPDIFLDPSKNAGGILQESASETVFLCLTIAREKMIRELKRKYPKINQVDIIHKLVAYTSVEANACVERAGLLSAMIMRQLPTNDNGSLIGSTLRDAILEDRTKGLLPCCVVATLGSTAICSFDNLLEIGPVCKLYNIWLHIDAAYAGSAFACPEFRYLAEGIEYGDSFNFNPHKWMLVNYECSALWLKNIRDLYDTFHTLHEENSSMTKFELQSIVSQGKFRALKLWIVLRSFGEEGIQRHIRNHVYLAEYLKKLIDSDERFEVFRISMGLVCFRLIGRNILTQKLIENLAQSKKIFIKGGRCKGKLFLRFILCNLMVEERDIDYAWEEIILQTNTVVSKNVTVLNSLKIQF